MNGERRIRYMRLVVFFDLPTDTPAQRKDYRTFRKFLIGEGYMMMQESVYVRLVTTDANADFAIARLKINHPPQGLVQVLKVTEKQYASMVYVTGEHSNVGQVDTMEELVVL